MYKLRNIAIATAAMLSLSATAAHASLIWKGVTYTLTETTTGNPLTDDFALTITGINSGSDTEGGRAGVGAFAFNLPEPDSLASAFASGFTEKDGGLSASGCDGHGNFFCFINNTTIDPKSTLSADSSLSFAFSVTLSSGSFSGYDPDFKVYWIGNKNNYSNVSQPLSPEPPSTNVPEPGSLALLGLGLLGLGLSFIARRKPLQD